MSCKSEQPDLFDSSDLSSQSVERLSAPGKANRPAPSVAAPCIARPQKPKARAKPKIPADKAPPVAVTASDWDPLVTRYLSDKMVAARYGVSRPTIWRWVKQEPDFPAPVKLASGSTRWVLDDLLAFEAARKDCSKPSGQA